MTAIVKCDFCGQVTDNPAAQIAVRLNGLSEYEATNPNMIKDMCKPCLDRLLEPKTLKVLTAEQAEVL
jgi:hypothetical protein